MNIFRMANLLTKLQKHGAEFEFEHKETNEVHHFPISRRCAKRIN